MEYIWPFLLMYFSCNFGIFFGIYVEQFGAEDRDELMPLAVITLFLGLPLCVLVIWNECRGKR